MLLQQVRSHSHTHKEKHLTIKFVRVFNLICLIKHFFKLKHFMTCFCFLNTCIRKTIMLSTSIMMISLVVCLGNSLSITSVSNKTTVTAGDPVELTCVGQPGNFVNISWSYNGKTVTSSEGVSIVDEIDQMGSGGGKKSVLRYRMMRNEDSGMHVCIVSNECGSDRSGVEVSVQSESNDYIISNTGLNKI